MKNDDKEDRGFLNLMIVLNFLILLALILILDKRLDTIEKHLNLNQPSEINK